ncbi:protein gp37 [Bradyrhizobium brasilense]|uniref:Protein gp37 n=1 Tax=Bradyrhizobium brasilense TaxID=1419277 RepID=A0A1G6YSF0_9BRAD|nr:phage Gp37/Gp68 family protein [Bradyrhizobium brasilense]SDD93288.1 protein gp37 [Bradyrhizobium brasilense]
MNSKIEWTTDTWNPIVGCSIATPGCTNCYAMAMAARIEAMNAEARETEQRSGKKRTIAAQYDGTTKKVNGSAVWTGKLALAGDSILLKPFKVKKPTTWFVNSMGDLFHEEVPDEWIDKVFAVMALNPHHTFQLLTKRAKRMRQWFDADRAERVGLTMLTIVDRIPYGHRQVPWPLPNVWLGVSTERQQEADERIPGLLATPAAIRFISAEPLLGPIDLARAVRVSGGADYRSHIIGKHLDWVIVGGESGPAARPMHPDWARSLRDQCVAANVPFFFKQWGAYRPLTEIEKVTACGATIVYPEPTIRNGPQGGVYMLQVPKKLAGRELDGQLHDAMPTDHVLQAPKRRVTT